MFNGMALARPNQKPRPKRNGQALCELARKIKSILKLINPYNTIIENQNLIQLHKL
jgi:hypothetical protein